MPDYIGALEAVRLNEASTLYCRRHCLNGSPVGHIMYINDATFDE